MDKETIETKAQELAEVVTYVEILKWLRGWENMKPTSSQYSMRDDQVAIGKRALQISNEGIL